MRSRRSTIVLTPEGARTMARDCAQQGAALLARAVNACDNPEIPYKYSAEDMGRFMISMATIVEIIERGRINILQAEAAKRDIRYQDFRIRLLNGVLKE